MASFKYTDGVRPYKNSSGATQANGLIVQLPDGMAGIIEGLAGIKNGATGETRVKGVVTVDAGSSTTCSAGDRIQLNTSTQVATVKASGAADSGNILIGRAIAAKVSGTLTIDVDLNGQGPTI